MGRPQASGQHLLSQSVDVHRPLLKHSLGSGEASHWLVGGVAVLPQQKWREIEDNLNLLFVLTHGLLHLSQKWLNGHDQPEPAPALLVPARP